MGLLDDAGAGEADEGAGLCDVEIAEHGEAGGDAACGGVGHDGDVRDLRGGASRRAKPAETLASCMRETMPSIMRAPPEAEMMMSGVAGGERTVYSAGDGLTDDGAHAAADEGVLHDREDDTVGADVADGVDDSVVEAGLLLGFGEAALIGLEIGEL